MDIQRVTLSRVGVLIALASIFAGLLFAQKIDDKQAMGKKSCDPPRYKIGLKYRTVEPNPALVVNISIEPSHFNREELIALSRKLNRDFHKENRLVAILFDDYQAAKHTVFNQESPTFKHDFAAMRGSYHLDLSKGEEYIIFSPNRDEPRNEIKIDLKANPSK